MKLYISGPMSGMSAFNIPAFDALADMLRPEHEVVSPAELDDPAFRLLCLRCPNGTSDELNALCVKFNVPQATWGDLLARDVKLLTDGDIEGVVVMDGWEKSRGAILETMVARLAGLPIYLPPLHPGLRLRPVHFAELEDAHAKAAGWLNGVNAQPLLRLDECGIAPHRDCDRDPAQVILPPPMRQHQTSPETGPNYGLETRVTSKTGGQKGEKKAVIGDICPKALKLMAEVAGFGRKKYDRLNYLKGFEYSLAYDAAQRHLNEFWAGNEIDEESELPHLAHAAWQCLCLLAFRLRGIGTDDRP